MALKPQVDSKISTGKRCSQQFKGFLRIFLVQTLGWKTSGAAPPQFCSLGFALGKSLGISHTAPKRSFKGHHTSFNLIICSKDTDLRYSEENWLFLNWFILPSGEVT